MGTTTGKKCCFDCLKYVPKEEIHIVYTRTTEAGKPLKVSAKPVCEECYKKYNNRNNNAVE